MPCHDHSLSKALTKPFFLISSLIIISALSANFLAISLPEPVMEFNQIIFNISAKIWWGLLLGILSVILISNIPQEIITSQFGKNTSFRSLIKSSIAGIVFDICNHGILLITMKLYKKGASLGNCMAFLIASPWNSLSTTIILISLIGFKFTLLFIALSMIIAICTGWIFHKLVTAKNLPANHYHDGNERKLNFFTEIRKVDFSLRSLKQHIKPSIIDSIGIIQWIFIGIILTALLQTILSPESFQGYFAANLMGLGLTLALATILEVCSEGSLPLAGELLTNAKAPGNSFAFLMGGVATDYTEILALRQTTKSWKIALFLPLISLPQIILLSLLLNQ
jgi:uncharacterized protein